MRKLFPAAVILLFSSLHSIAAADFKYQWKKGSDFYLAKEYDSAAYYFGQIAALKPNNAEVYYNLGNTWYRLNKIGPAVLNYERALRLDPDYKEAKDNLTLAQGRIANHIPYTGDIFFLNWWQTLTRPDRATPWAIASLITFALIMLLLLVRNFQLKKGKAIPLQLPGVLGFICLCLLILAFASAKNKSEHTGAVVMQADAPLMNNEQKGKPMALIPEGTSVKIRSEKSGWIEVTIPDGRTGWLQQNLIEKI
jgi:tetratricopeptide (TPR) repeat protein